MPYLHATTNLNTMPTMPSRFLPPSRLRSELRWAAFQPRNPKRALEIVPSHAVQGRGLRTQRLLAAWPWLLRDADTGAYLAVLDTRGAALLPLRRPCPGALQLGQRPSIAPQLLRELEIDRTLASRGGQRTHPAPDALALAGRDRYGRALWLSGDAGRAWNAMQRAAAREGIQLQAISGFRSAHYQAAIIRRKRARGLAIEEILKVNAAPGFSEHHSGRALDIGCPGEPPAEESFERTSAFAWLQAKAARFGFHLSYPRDNPYGIAYEPWHWCWHPPGCGSLRQRNGT